eukprot:456059_1
MLNMSILVKAVRFRSLSDQLTDKEYTTFITQVIKSHGRQLLNRYIFQQFIPTNTSNISELDNLINIISNIIQSRKQKKQLLSPTNIDQFPAAIIGFIASYLNQNEYTSFESTNRYVYVSCNSPNTLQYLDLTNVSDISNINLCKYESIKELSLNITTSLDHLKHSSSTITQTLDHLILTQDLKSDEYDFINKSFVEQNFIHNSNIKALSLSNMKICTICNDTFIKFCHKFPNIKHLELSSCHGCCMLDAKDLTVIKPLFPKLHTLQSCDDCYLIGELFIELFADQIVSLWFVQDAEELIMFMENSPKINFPKLLNLGLIHPSFDTINRICTTAKNLKSLHICPRMIYEVEDDNGIINDNQVEWMTAEENLKWIIDSIVNIKTLQMIEFAVIDNVKQIVATVVDAFHQTKDVKRERFVINFFLSDKSKEKLNMKDIMSFTNEIILCMAKSKTNQFEINWELNNFKRGNIAIAVKEYICVVNGIKTLQLDQDLTFMRGPLIWDEMWFPFTASG